MRSLPNLLVIALLLPGCREGTDPAQPAPSVAPPPEGAVVQLGPGDYLAEPVYITASEIDRWVPTISRFEPEETRRSWRRKALTNVNLPIRVCAAVFPEERRAVEEEIRALRERIVAGHPLPVGGVQIERAVGHGGPGELGLAVWGAAHELPQGEWSDVVEIPGGFVVLRRISPDQEVWTPNVPIEIEHVTLRFVPMEEVLFTVEDARPKLGVRPLDAPEWEGILPEHYRYETPKE